jgi:peptidoglycan hydrolase CwlO-like protein
MKHTNLRLFFLAIALLGFSACATIDEMNADITTLKSDVASLNKETQSLQDLRKEVADLSVQVDEMQNNQQAVRGRVDENQH